MLSEPKALGIQPDSRLEDRSLRPMPAQRKRREGGRPKEDRPRAIEGERASTHEETARTREQYKKSQNSANTSRESEIWMETDPRQANERDKA